MGQTPQATSNKQSNTTSTYQDAPATPHEIAIQNANPQPPSEPLSLWYTAPATNWVREALPIGNGDMGAMILGGVAQDRIQFNHKTLWKGTSKPTDLGSYLPFGDIYITNLNAKTPRATDAALTCAQPWPMCSTMLTANVTHANICAAIPTRSWPFVTKQTRPQSVVKHQSNQCTGAACHLHHQGSHLQRHTDQRHGLCCHHARLPQGGTRHSHKRGY